MIKESNPTKMVCFCLSGGGARYIEHHGGYIHLENEHDLADVNDVMCATGVTITEQACNIPNICKCIAKGVTNRDG